MQMMSLFLVALVCFVDFALQRNINNNNNVGDGVACGLKTCPPNEVCTVDLNGGKTCAIQLRSSSDDFNNILSDLSDEQQEDLFANRNNNVNVNNNFENRQPLRASPPKFEAISRRPPPNWRPNPQPESCGLQVCAVGKKCVVNSQGKKFCVVPEPGKTYEDYMLVSGAVRRGDVVWIAVVAAVLRAII
jgi:hypothetical protein